MSKIETRITKLEASTTQRTTYVGLCALVQSGKLAMADLTDEELTRIATGQPGDIDVRQLSNAELEVIISGGGQ
jgi:hypothetical protein